MTKAVSQRAVSQLVASQHADNLRLSWALRAGERELWIASGSFVAGRGADADLQLDEESVSRKHALFRLGDEGPPSVEDLGSRNGTFVNDRRIAGRVLLDADDCVALGAYQLQVIRAQPREPFRSAPITRPLLRPLVREALAGQTTVALEALSPRERELFSLLAQGLPQREIAEQLGISIKTVETHRTRIGHKLGLRTRAELIRCALDNAVLR